MFRNYFKIAVRNLWKHKTFTVINIVGLAVAFGAAILLSLTAFQEFSFDHFHVAKDRIYQLYREEHHPGKTVNNSSFPIPFTPALKEAYPDVVLASRFGSIGSSLLRYRDHEFNYTIRTVDPDFLQMFTFPLETGDKAAALRDQGNIVLTRTIATNIFGSEDPIGKTIEMKDNDQWKPFIVSAIAKDVPKNSSLTFAALIRFENFPNYRNDLNRWGSSNHATFIELAPGATQVSLEQKMKKFMHQHYDSTIIQMKLDGGQPDKEGELMRTRMIPLSGLHFSDYSNFAQVSRFFPWLLLLIGGFILFIASINFVNLSLGRSFTRAREIGMRKVLGALRKQVLIQFWGEALIICIIALITGAILASALMPGYKSLFHLELNPATLATPSFLAAILGSFLLVSLLAGGYPAWIISAMQTTQTVKGKVHIGKDHRLRNGLMVVQFVLSGLLIICTGIIWQQVSYMRSAPLGYNKEQVISIPVGGKIDGSKALDRLRIALSGTPGVLGITGADNNLGRGRDGSISTSIIGFDHNGKTVHSNWLRVDYDYVKTLDLQLVKGRDFSREYSTDSNVVVINERMAAALGDKDPLTAVLDMDNYKLKVIGVVKDFHFQSLHQEIAPLSMVMDRSMPLHYIFVKVTATNLPASMAAVEKGWKQINPGAEAALSFLDENTDNQYKKEERMARIFISGATLAILISCMGLFAIIVLVLGQRTREIGIRKVLGASVLNILTLVAREFLLLVLLAILIASPIAWYIMNQWLGDYAYRIHINIWIFIFSAAIAVLIALATISFQTIRTARINPVDNLKSE